MKSRPQHSSNAYQYPPASSAYHFFIRHHSIQIPSAVTRNLEYLFAPAVPLVQRIVPLRYRRRARRVWRRWRIQADQTTRIVLLVLIVIWMILLYWGERWTFSAHVERCAWDRWEQWPLTSSTPTATAEEGDEEGRMKEKMQVTPHRLILVADPQLVDPHTYPGRPWPLSSLTVQYTDLYLRRSFALMQERLDPDTVLFLGDLFDGGREWSTRESTSPEEQWRKYGQSFWLKEYERFGKIFFDAGVAPGVTRQWGKQQQEHSGQRQGRKMIASLPGNHDFGLGTGIQIPVRDRFHAFFGEGNRIDVIANHTFVSVDTVSLSAKGQPDAMPPDRQGDASSSSKSQGNEQLWRSTQDFLDGAQRAKKRAVERELRYFRDGTVNRGRNQKYRHAVLALGDSPLVEAEGKEDGDESHGMNFPTILLTHIPLYRAAGTPCGPLREHWPPSKNSNSGGGSSGTEENHHGKDDEEERQDERNAIALRGGTNTRMS